MMNNKFVRKVCKFRKSIVRTREKKRNSCAVNRLDEFRIVETIVQWIHFISFGRFYSFYIRFAGLLRASSPLQAGSLFLH